MAIKDGELNHVFAPIILAGGSGTRFWPRSRRAKAKQVLSLDGERTMIQQTLDRLMPLADTEGIWIITNNFLDNLIAEQLPALPRKHILSEPVPRNTAPACGLAAFLFEKIAPTTVIGMFPSDHIVKDNMRFSEIVSAGIALAAGGDRIVVLGVTPTRAETGYGYIEQGEVVDAVQMSCKSIPVRRVKRFTEKPNHALAEEFMASGNYAWNSGIFLWAAGTLANAIREYHPAMASLLEKIAVAYGTPNFEQVFAEMYPLCENISIDYAVLEPRSNKGEREAEIYCLPGDFGWNDLGCWDALHEHAAACDPDKVSLTNVFDQTDSLNVTIESYGNYIYAPGKMIGLVGVKDLVVVQTNDALLVTTRNRSQDVGKIVAELKKTKREDLF